VSKNNKKKQMQLDRTELDPRDLETIAMNKDYHDVKTAMIRKVHSNGLIEDAVERHVNEDDLRVLCANARESSVTSILCRRVDLIGGLAPDDKTKYDFAGLLGKGGMGQVLLVTDNDIRRRVAMKLLLPQHRQNSELVERFLDEVQIAGQLEHPNIPPIYDMGSVDEEPFFTMRLVEGDTLREVLDRLRDQDKETHEEYTLIRRLQIFQQLCMGMAYAHEKGVVHRDLKPANVMIGAFGEVLIMDWGLAMLAGAKKLMASPPKEPSHKSNSGRVTTTRVGLGTDATSNSINGTPVYMSPEQARGDNGQISARSDIYSLGAMLYELLTLSVPLRGRTTFETMLKVGSVVPAKPSVRASEYDLTVPEVFDEICMKALDKDPKQRYKTALEFADEVQAYIDGSRERERCQQEASAHIVRGYEFTRSYFKVRASVEKVRRERHKLQKKIPGFAPLDAKRELWDLDARIDTLEQDQARYYETAHDSFDAALGIDSNDSAAREAKADLFWEYFLAAESRGDGEGARHFRARVEAFHDGKYEQRLNKAGTLYIKFSPPPDRLHLTSLVEKDHVLVEHEGRPMDADCKSLDNLSPGHYILRAWREGSAPVTVPLFLKRSEDLILEQRFYPKGAIPEEFVIVTGGQGILGGDLNAPSSLPRTEVTVKDVLIARYPVSAGQYLDFVNDIARHSEDQALARVPRIKANTEPLWKPDGNGLFDLSKQQFQKVSWDADWPIFGLSYGDAIGYCHWRSKVEKTIYRLPTELEWEWAARGPAGLCFPWGHRFEPNFCKMKLSRQGYPMPEVLGTFDTDCSPFGVRDMAGGVHEWCTSEFDEERAMVVLRGGAWVSIPARCRSAARIGDQPYDRHSSYGFRLARDLDRQPKA
jgi:eukaryotic-like serine/threonine-protein kinase